MTRPDNARITEHHDSDPGEDPWVHGAPPVDRVEVIAYDPAWPTVFETIVKLVRVALGDAVLGLDHVGSTSVPGLAAKPVIDLVLTVADSTNEASYVPALTAAGFDLTVREPAFHQHRCFRRAVPRANLHVFGPDSPETFRMLLFRDWLINRPEDRERYEKTKLAAAGRIEPIDKYNLRKQAVIREIYDRAFRAVGLL